jgi:uncharacterized membrane protein YdbT with pleckstrin-like domain
MSYVDSVLATGERVVHRAAISHWHYFGSYLFALACFAAAVGMFYLPPEYQDVGRIGAAAVAVVGVIVVLVALIRRSSTELVLTDRRIIAKTGFVSRDTVEMNLGKVESLRVSQGLLGRMLDFGDVAVVGTGSSLEPLRGISDPLALRRKLGEIASPQSPSAV